MNKPCWSFLLSINQQIFHPYSLVVCDHVISLGNITSLTISCSGPWTILSFTIGFWFNCTLHIWMVQDLADSYTTYFISNYTIFPALTVMTVHHANSEVTWKVCPFTKERCLNKIKSNKTIHRSINQSINQTRKEASVSQSVSQSDSQSVRRLAGQSAITSQSVNQPVNQLFSQSISHTNDQPVSQTDRHLVGRSVSQSVMQSSSQLVGQSVGQTHLV